MDLGGLRTVRSGADSLAVSLLRTFDSLRKATPGAFKDTSAAGKRAALQQAVAEFVFRGHPSAAAYKRLAPTGLDTAKVNRQILTLAAKSGLTLGEVVKQWNLAMDYASARQLVAALSVDSSSLNPFQLETALRLDTLRPGEPPVGLLGKIKGKKGVKSIEYVIENDSGLRTDRFVLADFPDLNANPATVDLAGHPTFAPRANAVQGAYTLRLLVKDALGNEQVYATAFHVGAELDHKGPSLIVLSPTSAVVRDFNDSQLVVKVEAKDPSGVKSVTIDGKVADKGEDGIWFDTLVVPVRDSSQLVKIEAKDVFGNASDAQIQIRRNQKPIPTAPRLKLVSPASGTLVAFEDSVVRVVWKAETDFGKIDSVTIDGVQAKAENGTWVRELILPANGKTTSFGVRAYSSVPLTATEYVSIGRKADNAGPVVVWSDAAKSQRITYDVKQTEISVTASDLSGVDSVRIGGSKVNPLNKEWKATVLLAGPGELTRILVEAWDHAGNRTDTELVVARDGVPSSLPPSVRWVNPTLRTGTLIPFADSGIWIRVALTDLSGMDSGSVKIAGLLAKPINDSVWERWVGLPPNGIAQAITLEAKNKRGVAISDFAMLTRDRDTVKSVALSDTNGKLRAGSFWVKLTCPTPGANIHYTLDGTDPTTSSPKFADSIKIDTTITLKARAYAKDRVDGPVVTQKYQLAVPVGVSFGSTPTLVLMSDASLWGMGTYNCSAIPDGKGCDMFNARKILTPTKVADNVSGMSSSWWNSVWVDLNGSLWGVGKDVRGSMASGADGDYFQPIQLTQGVVLVVNSGGGLFVLKKDGSLWGSGSNGNGQLGVGDFNDRNLFVKIASNVIDVGCGEYGTTLFLKEDKSLWIAGKSLGGDLRDSLPRKIMESVEVIPRYFFNSALIAKADGSLWGMGVNEEWQLGVDDSLVRADLTKIHDGFGEMAVQIAQGRSFSAVLTKSGRVMGMGSNQQGALGLQAREFAINPVEIANGVRAIAASEIEMFYISMDGALFGTGSNFYGALGLGHENQVSVFTRIRL
ncbi:MAG: chitobiase/beta-hexosaminidase C-terminal domain-containing protein [Fibrobacteres bacterium]|nr:chitobiase/beta-hexosaminidase C-terminal domain-containing protein [Fibrobacterota bacterium]